MKKFLLVISCLFSGLIVKAQMPQTVIPLTSANVQIVPIGGQGFLLMDLAGTALNQNQVSLPITHYDALIKEKWKNILPVSRGLQLRHYQIVGEHLFMIFAGPKDQFLELYRLDLLQGHFQRSQYKFSNSFTLESMSATSTQLWVSGTMSNQGVLFSLDEAKNAYHILPTAYAEKVNGIRELHFDPQQGLLSFLLLTSKGKQQTYVLRSLQILKNSVKENLEFVPPAGLQLTQARLIRKEGARYLTGTFFKKNPEQALGVFLYEIKAGTLSKQQFHYFKEIPQFAEFTFWTGSGADPKDQSKKGLSSVLIDDVLAYDGGLLMSLELLEKRYQTKGALQQDIERNQLVNNLDQDQYGRRALDQNAAEDQTVEDRINKRSATDILQYRYRNALVAQPTFQGLGFERSVLMTFDDQLNQTSCYGMKTGKPEMMYLGAPNTFISKQGIRQFYDLGGSFFTWLYHPSKQSFDAFDQGDYAESSGRIFRLGADDYIVATLNKEKAGFLLTLKKWQLTIDQP